MSNGISRTRLLLILPAGLCLLLGLNAALLLLGVWAPLQLTRLADVHGMLLVVGFLGTVISLERSVAYGKRRGYAVPLLLAFGALSMITAFPSVWGKCAMVAGAAGLVAVYVPLFRRQPNDATLVQVLGAVVLFGATVLFARGVPVPDLLPYLAAFPILTIAGERLELARIQAPPVAAQRVLVAIALLILVASTGSLLWPVTGGRLFGIGLLALLVWLYRYDVARKLIHATGLPRFTARCLLSGYIWLTIAALLWVNVGDVALTQPAYDATIHATFLGFVMLMIMAHAPIILPAVIHCQLSYHVLMYVPVILLQSSLFLRIFIGDLHQVRWAFLVGAVGNVIALISFAGVVIWRAKGRT